MKKPLSSEMIKKAKRRNLWAFMGGNVVSGFGDSCLNIAYIPFLYEVTNYDLFLTGLMVTIFQIMWFLPSPIAGRLSDRFGRKTMMILSAPVSIFGITLLFFVNQTNLYLLVISTILRPLGFMSGGLNYQILITESKEESNNGLGHIFGVMAFLYFGSTIGGSIFVNLTGFEYKYYFMIFLITYIINWIKNIIFITDTAQLKNNGRINSEKKDWRELFKNSKVQTAIVFLTMDIFFWGISTNILNAGLQDQYGLTLENLAFFNIWFNISNMLFQIPAGKLTDKINKKKVLILSQIFGLIIFMLHILIYFAIQISTDFNIFLFPCMITIQILFGLSVSTFIPSESMILTDLDDSRKGESYGMVSFVRGFGAIPTGIIGGFLIGNVHFIAPFVMTFIGIIFEILYLLKFGDRFDEIKDKVCKSEIQKLTTETMDERL
ncbi:MAG: MFS transporter [Promethearchaeota archaeon]